MGDAISSRKEEHVRVCVESDVGYHGRRSGFERWEFEHNALPEIDFSEVDPSTDFLGSRLSFPLLVTGMTGGYPGARDINEALARVCEELGIALGSGSMRRALLDPDMHPTYTVLREQAPTIPLLANIGAPELARSGSTDDMLRLVELISADALAVHCNPLQEFLQPEGNPDFRGVLNAIERLVRELPVPVVVKEVGSGISAAVARRLFDAGVRYIDVAGAGGTSWARVEILRRNDGLEVSEQFKEWGICTADALIQVARIAPEDAFLLASGGISDGVDIAKSIALGASIAGAARPLLTALIEGGEAALRMRLLSWKNDLRGVMFLSGVRSVPELSHTPLRTASTYYHLV